LHFVNNSSPEGLMTATIADPPRVASA
jgi:hypothetical protein